MDHPCYYYSNDPIENLSIRVTLRKIADGDTEDKTKRRKKKKTKKDISRDAGAHEPPKATRSWSSSFRWQEKLFGPREFCKYRGKDEGILSLLKKPKRIETEYRKAIHRCLRNGDKILDEEASTVLFTYTDKDEFVPAEELEKSVTSSSADMSDLAKNVITIPERGASARHSTGIEGRLAREACYKAMYILASVEIDSSEYEQKSPDFEEHVLCAIKYYPNKTLCVTPAFSIPLSTELDPDARKKGPKLSTYKFHSENGGLYEFVVENESELLDSSQQLVNELNMLQLQEERHEVQQWQHRCGEMVFDKPPKFFDARVIMNIELISAHAFEASKLYIQYELVLPECGWQWQSDAQAHEIKQMQFGSTQTTYVSTAPALSGISYPESVAHFGFPIELNMLKNISINPLASAKRPQLIVEVFSRDGWERNRVEGYGVIDLPTSPGFYERWIETWKPKGTIRDQMQDFFVGGSNQLLDSRFVSYPEGPSRFRSKYGFNTESSGKVRVRLNVLEQRNLPEQLVKSDQGGIASKRTVNDILGSLRKPKGSLRSREPSSSRSTSSSGSAQDILSALKQRRLTRQEAKDEE